MPQLSQYRNKGMTLIEVIVVVVILGIVAAVGSYALTEGITSYISNQDIIEANWQTLNSLEKMARQIRAIRSPTSITTATSTQLAFTDIYGNSVSYQYSGTDLLLNSNTLISGVSSFAFNYLDRNAATTATLANIRYVTISLTINQNNVTYNMRTTINARNLP